MKVNMKKLIRALIVGGLLLIALTLLAAYAAIKLSGREIVSSSDIKAKDDQIARFEKLYEMQDDIDADFLFDADKD